MIVLLIKFLIASVIAGIFIGYMFGYLWLWLCWFDNKTSKFSLDNSVFVDIAKRMPIYPLEHIINYFKKAIK